MKWWKSTRCFFCLECNWVWSSHKLFASELWME